MKKRFLKVLAVSMLPAVLLGTVTSCGNSNSDSIIEVSGPTGPTAPSIYAQHGNCRNHAAFHYLKDN